MCFIFFVKLFSFKYWQDLAPFLTMIAKCLKVATYNRERKEKPVEKGKKKVIIDWPVFWRK